MQGIVQSKPAGFLLKHDSKSCELLRGGPDIGGRTRIELDPVSQIRESVCLRRESAAIPPHAHCSTRPTGTVVRKHELVGELIGIAGLLL